jgi:carboxyl-terminal processing protease
MMRCVRDVPRWGKRERGMRRLLALVLAGAALGCAVWTVGGRAAVDDPLHVVEAAMSFLQENSVFRYEIDWSALAANGCSPGTVGNPDGAETPAGAVECVVQQLQADYGDTHASLDSVAEIARTEEAMRLYLSGDETEAPPWSRSFAPVGGIVDSGSAYLWVPSTTSSFAGFYSRDFACARGREIRSLVAELAAQNPTGWVIDLRWNSGGSLMADLIGFADLLPEGRLLGFAAPNPDGACEIDSWVEKKGAIFLSSSVGAAGTQSESVVVDLSDAPPVPQRSVVPIAILTSPNTASAAEMLLVALRQNLNVRTFGEPTSGISTSRAAKELPDGSVLYVSTAYLADPLGHIYRGPSESTLVVAPGTTSLLRVPGEPIRPDVAKANPHWDSALHEVERMTALGPQAYMEPRYDPAYRAALAWIREEATAIAPPP